MKRFWSGTCKLLLANVRVTLLLPSHKSGVKSRNSPPLERGLFFMKPSHGAPARSASLAAN